ncbi:MAG: CRISPR system precrRNA processing endoribonuclease RAMP protein Cas6, partial [Cyanobacteria bacterium J06555_13]
MLICSTWQLSVNTSITLPISYGLALTKHVHAQAGIEFGQQEAMPSSTFSGLLGRGQTAEGFVTFYPDEVYTLSLSGLHTTTSQKIADFELSKQFEFLGATFDVGDRTDTKTTYEALYHQYVASEPEPTRQFSLSFQSPTAFSQQRTYLPLPVPTLLFRSWLERWNHFSSIYLGGQDLIGYVENSVVLSRHRIQSNPFSVHKSNITGFTGNIRLNVLHRSDPVLAQVLNLLVHYAQFSGTGIKTRLG